MNNKKENVLPFFKNTKGESNVNIITTDNGQLPTNNTSALLDEDQRKSGVNTFLSEERSKDKEISPQSAARRAKLAELEAARPSASKRKEDALDAKYAKTQELRKSIQESADNAAKKLIKSEELFRVEVSLYKTATQQVKANIDILLVPNTKFLKYTCTMQNKRARELTSNIPNKRDWEPYEIGKELIKSGSHVGKLKLRNQSGKNIRIACKVLPYTMGTIRTNGVNLIFDLYINDMLISIPLDPTDELEYYSDKGIWQADEEVIDLGEE